MSAIPKHSADSELTEREARVDAAIAEFLQASESGPAPNLAEFLRSHTDIADELREFLADHAAFADAAVPLRTSTASHLRDRTPTDEQLPRSFGPFQLLRLIGRGGMSNVFEATRRSGSLDHRAQVAVKVLHPWLALDATSVLRFEREACAVRSLSHPHVVCVLEVGQEQGTPYLVMPLVDGQSLDRASAREQLSGHSDLARRFAEVAAALQHAHERGVIHRDVKPSNLLLAADGRLLISDFGLARLIEQPKLTRTGEVVGSPAYMSPEQIASRGEDRPVDQRTDVYSLGATIYEVLTGRPPFVADSREQLLASIQNDEPIAPRVLRPDIPCDLETIVLRTLEKNPRDRFESAGELAADLRRFADGQPIHARRGGLFATARRWKHRQRISRGTLIATGLCFVALIAGMLAASQLRQRALAEQRQQAIDSALVVALTGDLSETELAIVRAERAGVSAEWLEILRGQVAFHRGQYADAIAHLSRAQDLSPNRASPVAATAVLATAHLAAGSWEQYESLLELAESETARTPEDFLFRGEAESYLDPQRAARSLDIAVQRRDTPLARLCRAEALTNLAFDSSQFAAVKQALEDVRIAKALLRGHPAALLESLNAHVIAAELSSQSGHLSRRDSELTAAEEDFRSLEPFAHLPTVIHNRTLYLLLTGREDEAFDRLKTATAQHADPLVAYDLALAQYRHGELAAALQTLKSRGPAESLSSDEAFLLVVLLHETGDKSAATTMCDQLEQRFNSGVTACFHPALHLVRGLNVESASESRVLSASSRKPRLRAAHYDSLLAYLSGDISSERWLLLSEPSRWNQCEAHFFIALQQLADGDRETARRHFEQCVATRCAGFLAWDWSHAFLRRLATDDDWPR